jgi:hypothetical protein
MRYITAILALLSALQLSAQSLKVSVRDADGPLPFANIYLNGKYLTSANQEGVAEIAEGALNPGDTVSSSYLGYAPASAVYDQTMRAARSCTLVHVKEHNYDIEEIVVTAGMDGWEAFQKFIDPKETPRGRYVLKGDFGARITLPDGAIRDVNGTFSISDVNSQSDVFNAPVTLATTSDTTAVSQTLEMGIRLAPWTANGMVNRLGYVHRHKRERENPYRILNYLGLRNGKRNFTFTYVAPDMRGTNQALLQVGGESKFVESMHFESTAEKWPEAFINSVTIDFKPYRKEGRGVVFAIPTRIEVDFRPDERGYKTDLTLSGITIETAK